MNASLKFDFQKRKQLLFFLNKLSKLHKKKKKKKKNHVATSFSLKQGETRTKSIPISQPLKGVRNGSSICLFLFLLVLGKI